MKICPQCQHSYPISFAVCPQDGARLTEPLEWAAGTVIRGKYRIVGKIGEGGMGAVYKALHMHFNESCALKVMAPSLLNDAGLVKRFGREAIIARKLRHKNAVKVEDFDETEDGRPFIVMEYIEGQSLKSLMNAHGPLPVARSCSIIKQAAAALDAAHQLGLVHRDIKPDNIVLVFSNGEEVAKVLDFGIAKIRDSQSTASGMALTATGMVIGTPPYMSPEQAKGADSDELDGRSDIYSLGVVMYQMLTGVLPLKADTPLNMLFAQIQTPPTPIYDARPGLQIPAPVGDLIMKCLEKDRERRPQSGRELIEGLEQCEKGVRTSGGTSSPAKPAKDFSDSTTVRDTPAPLAGRGPAGSSTVYADEPTVRTPTASQERRVPTTPRIPPIPTIPPGAAPSASSEFASPEIPDAANGAKTSSSGAIFAAVIVFVLALAAGGWYFVRRGSSVVQSNPAAPTNDTQPAAAKPPAAQLSSPEVSTAPADSHGANSSSEHAASSARETTDAKPKHATREIPAPAATETEAEKAARAKTVDATSSLGDLYFQNGEYDNAIKEYTRGLEADPSNKSLQDKVAAAVKAKASSQTPKQ
ncbi:MAG: protein kinase [Candidatus Acidiferrum sp.]|jgi:serine/threonine protein kinase